jgi:hypothetical protein
MSRRKQLTRLTPPEVERFIQPATELHKACCGPVIAPASDHARALTRLNQEIIVAIEAITGDKAPWMKTPPHFLHPSYEPQ